ARYVDFLAKNCDSVHPGTSTTTLSSTADKEKECASEPLHNPEDRKEDGEATPLDVSTSVNIGGITGQNLVF
ncbi:MAG: hypothetical protein Q9169_005602, partial [Polycauliona sp. 2 TL-2023]